MLRFVLCQVFFYFFVFISSLSLTAQTLVYDIIKGKNTLGQMTVNRTQIDNRESVLIKSHFNINLIINISIGYFMYEKFVNKQLVSGNTYRKIAGSTQKKTKIVKLKNSYRIEIDDETKIWNDRISYSISQIYFTEPHHMQQVFSQQYGSIFTFEKRSPNTYLLTLPNGETYYTYEKGICTEVKINRSYANFRFVLDKKSRIDYLR